MRFVTVAGMLVLALLPPLARVWQEHMATHLLVQYPLLVAAGVLMGAPLARQTLARGMDTRWSAAAALLWGAFALGFWLLPRWVDAALAGAPADRAKAASLVLLVGIPWGWGWTLAGPVLRAFAWANGVSMLIAMGWLQIAVPVRLCNRYLVSDQYQYGRALIVVAGLVLAGGLLRVMVGRAPDAGRQA